jgi:hypothetical protein
VKRRTWTPERDALFRAELPDNTDPAGLLARLNELPGDPIAGLKAMMLYAHKKGIKRRPEACLEIQRIAGLSGNRKRTTAAGGRIITVWSEARNERLLEGRRSGETPEDTLAALNALPGLPIARISSLRGQLKKMRARGVDVPARLPGPRPGTVPKSPPPVRIAAQTSPPAVEEPPPPPKPCPELADAAAEARNDRVKDAIRRAMKGGRLPWESAVAIANRHGVTPQRVLVLVGLVR